MVTVKEPRNAPQESRTRCEMVLDASCELHYELDDVAHGAKQLLVASKTRANRTTAHLVGAQPANPIALASIREFVVACEVDWVITASFPAINASDFAGLSIKTKGKYAQQYAQLSPGKGTRVNCNRVRGQEKWFG